MTNPPHGRHYEMKVEKHPFQRNSIKVGAQFWYCMCVLVNWVVIGHFNKAIDKAWTKGITLKLWLSRASFGLPVRALGLRALPLGVDGAEMDV